MAHLSSPFIYPELRGYFRWTQKLTESFPNYCRWIYLAVHTDDLRDIIAAKEIAPKRSFETCTSDDEDSEPLKSPCSWWSLQSWHTIRLLNHFGPYIVRVPMEALNGRRFYLYDRGKVRGSTRIYFVERIRKTALFKTGARRIDPLAFFVETDRIYHDREKTVYEFVLTTTVSTHGATVQSTNHPRCFARIKCAGNVTRKDADKRLAKIVGRPLRRRSKYRFPDPFPLQDAVATSKRSVKTQIVRIREIPNGT